MPSGGNVEYMEDITSDEGSPERVEGQKQPDRAQAPDSNRSSTLNARNREDVGRGADQNIPADRNSAPRKSVQAPNNASVNSARENLQPINDADHSRPKRARVAGPQLDEQSHEQSVDRPKRPLIQPPPKKGFELPNDKLLGNQKDEPSTSAKHRKRTSAASPPPTLVYPNDKLLASKKDERTTSSKNRTRRAEASPPRITFEYQNDKLLKNARKRSHDEANRSSDSENDVSQKPRISRKKSGDDQRKTISAKKLGIAQRKVLSTQELRERRMQPLNGAYDPIPPVVPVYPLRTGHVGYNMGQAADIRIPPEGHRLLSNRTMASMKDFNIPGNLQPEDYDDDFDDDDDYLSGLDEYDSAQNSELIPCVVDPRTGQLVPISQPVRRLQPPPQSRSTTATSETLFKIRLDEKRQVRRRDDAQFPADGFLQQRAPRQMLAPGIAFDGITGLDSYAYAREPNDFDEQNQNYLHYRPDALLQQRVAPVQPNIHHQAGSIAAPRRSAGPPNNGTDYAEASSVDPRHARLAVSDYALHASIPTGQSSRGIRQPDSGLLIHRQLTTTAQSGSAQTPKTPDEIDQVLDALANGDRHQRAQHYFDSPSPQAAGHSSGTQQRTVIRRMVPGDPQHAGSSTSGSRKASTDGSGSSGRDAEYQQRTVKEEIIDDGELDELSRSPADASDDIDPQQFHAAMEDVALDNDRTHRLMLEPRIEQLTAERDQYLEYATSVTKRLQQCKCGKRAERPQDAGQPSDSGTGQSSYGSAEQLSLSIQPASHSQRNGSDSRPQMDMSTAQPSNANGQYSQSSSTTTIRRLDQRSSSTATHRNDTYQQRSSNTRGQTSSAHQARPIAGAKPYR